MRIVVIALYFYTIGSLAGEIDFSGWVAVASKDVGTIGRLADDNPVLQTFGKAEHESDVYVAYWVNYPLDTDNAYASKEIDLIVGVNKVIGSYTIDASIAFFDIENPVLADFDNDVISPKIQLNKGNYYAEAKLLQGMSGREGWLTGAGGDWRLSGEWGLSANINYTCGPFSFQRLLFMQSKLTYTPEAKPISLFVELTNQLYRQQDEDRRKAMLLFGLRYMY